MGYNDRKILAAIVSLPLILIHGYSDDSTIWHAWERWLEQDNITKVTSINFKDSCDTVKVHTHELKDIIKYTLNETGESHVNIVSYSKGGLDARYYISQNPDKVANLVMLGTPNLGTPAAYMDITDCMGGPGLTDLWPDSEATKVPDSPLTNYYTIAGNVPSPCAIIMIMGDCQLTENDGFVPVKSALSHYTSLGVYPVNHGSLLNNEDIYHKVLPIIGDQETRP